MPLPILYLDDSFVAVNKPSGMLVHRGAAQDTEVAMTAVRDQLGSWVYPVHRLDRGTSGVLLFALTKASATALQAAMHEGQKEYLALVRGTPPERALIDHPVPNDEGGPKVEARTTMERLAVLHPDGAPFPHYYAWVRAWPETGRRHQIRRHLKHLGHPLVGDTTYGRSEHNHYFAETFSLRRLALHAASMQLRHPLLGHPMHLVAPLPSDLCEPLWNAGLRHASAQRHE